MHDREHNNFGAFDPIVDPERKAMNERAPRVPVNVREHERCLRDLGESGQDLVKELMT